MRRRAAQAGSRGSGFFPGDANDDVHLSNAGGTLNPQGQRLTIDGNWATCTCLGALGGRPGGAGDARRRRS
jgi:hypothetical protein